MIKVSIKQDKRIISISIFKMKRSSADYISPVKKHFKMAISTISHRLANIVYDNIKPTTFTLQNVKHDMEKVFDIEYLDFSIYNTIVYTEDEHKFFLENPEFSKVVKNVFIGNEYIFNPKYFENAKVISGLKTFPLMFEKHYEFLYISLRSNEMMRYQNFFFEKNSVDTLCLFFEVNYGNVHNQIYHINKNAKFKRCYTNLLGVWPKKCCEFVVLDSTFLTSSVDRESVVGIIDTNWKDWREHDARSSYKLDLVICVSKKINISVYKHARVMVLYNFENFDNVPKNVELMVFFVSISQLIVFEKNNIKLPCKTIFICFDLIDFLKDQFENVYNWNVLCIVNDSQLLYVVDEIYGHFKKCSTKVVTSLKKKFCNNPYCIFL